MELCFNEAEYGDFYAIEEPPESWDLGRDDFVEFSAFNISEWIDTDEEKEAYNDGYIYFCYVWINNIELAKFPALNLEDAERLLQIAANALYEG